MKRMAKQIAKEVKLIKDLQQEYNSCCSSDIAIGHSLSLSSAYDLEYLSTLLTTAHTTPEMNSRHELIEEYVMLMRSREEVELLEIEANNAINFYSAKRTLLKQKFSIDLI